MAERNSMLISPTRLKAFVKMSGGGLRVGQDFMDTANALVIALVRRATNKAQRLHKKTLRSDDLSQSENMQRALFKLIMDHAQSSLESKAQRKELNATENAALELISDLKASGNIF